MRWSLVFGYDDIAVQFHPHEKQGTSRMHSVRIHGLSMAAIILFTSAVSASDHKPMFAGFPILDTMVVSENVKGDNLSAGSPPAIDVTCYVAGWIRSSGRIHVAQVVRSSGYPRLDDACSHGTCVAQQSMAEDSLLTRANRSTHQLCQPQRSRFVYDLSRKCLFFFRVLAYTVPSRSSAIFTE